MPCSDRIASSARLARTMKRLSISSALRRLRVETGCGSLMNRMGIRLSRRGLVLPARVNQLGLFESLGHARW